MSERSLDEACAIVARLFGASLKAVDPTAAVRSAIDWNAECLKIDDLEMVAPAGVHVIAVGKAAVAMTQGALERLDGAVVSGDVITKEGHVTARLPERIRIHEAGHPIPDQRGVRATQTALAALQQLSAETVVLALISGGGSALLEAPKNGLTLADLAATTDLLLRAGASIDALNAVRAPLSRVKAGGLRLAAPDATWVTLVLSDVLGNDPRVIASGPTVPGRNEPVLALQTIDRFELRDAIPPAVIAVLEGQRGERNPPSPHGDVLKFVGDNATAVNAAAEAARADGLAPLVIWHAVEGEAAELGRSFVRALDEAPDGVDVLLGGGEATVTVRGTGCGGRNTEFALAAALELERLGNHDWVVASLGTDGQDALTGLAGAIADPWTVERARELGFEPKAALERNDSAAVFALAGGVVDTGPTGTNVNDVYLAVRLRLSKSAGAEEGA
jgi:glycerate 2-kinase